MNQDQLIEQFGEAEIIRHLKDPTIEGKCREALIEEGFIGFRKPQKQSDEGGRALDKPGGHILQNDGKIWLKALTKDSTRP